MFITFQGPIKYKCYHRLLDYKLISEATSCTPVTTLLKRHLNRSKVKKGKG